MSRMRCGGTSRCFATFGQWAPESKGVVLKHDAIAKLRFAKDLRAEWPTAVLTAHARAPDGPWSIRAELWSPPNEEGTAFSWVSFLSPDAPVERLARQECFDVTLGETKVATCSLCLRTEND